MVSLSSKELVIYFIEYKMFYLTEYRGIKDLLCTSNVLLEPKEQVWFIHCTQHINFAASVIFSFQISTLVTFPFGIQLWTHFSSLCEGY